MRRCLPLCMLFGLLLPGFLSAQERWLRGKVVRFGEHEEKIPEVNITVALETGNTGNTNSLGVFRIFLKDIFKAGEVVRDFRLSGDAHYSNYIFDQALIAYERALTYVSRQQTPQSGAATLIDIGRANCELGIRAEGPAIAQYLGDAMKAYHGALELYTHAQLPQDWATTQNNLGIALQNQGIRTGGEAGAHLLAEAVTAYRQALEVGAPRGLTASMGSNTQ